MSDVALGSRAEEESRIAISWLKRLERILLERDPQLLSDCLRASGLSESYAADEQLVRMDQLDSAQLFARGHLPDITLRMYAASDLLDLGLIGYAMAASGTVQRPGRSRFGITTSPPIGISSSCSSSRPGRDSSAPIPRTPVRAYGYGGGTCRRGQNSDQRSWGFASTMEPSSASFAYAAPAYSEAYGLAFPGSLRFDAEHTEFSFPASWLKLPVTTANASTSAVCASMCERILGSGQLQQQTADLVRRLLVSRAGREVPTLESAAASLRVSSGQLRKRLYREGTTYKQLVLEVRMTLAQHYLEATSLSVQEIAYLLDYSQAAPFSRAFKRYFGYPPLAARGDLAPAGLPGATAEPMTSSNSCEEGPQLQPPSTLML